MIAHVVLIALNIGIVGGFINQRSITGNSLVSFGRNVFSTSEADLVSQPPESRVYGIQSNSRILQDIAASAERIERLREELSAITLTTNASLSLLRSESGYQLKLLAGDMNALEQRVATSEQTQESLASSSRATATRMTEIESTQRTVTLEVDSKLQSVLTQFSTLREDLAGRVDAALVQYASDLESLRREVDEDLSSLQAAALESSVASRRTLEAWEAANKTTAVTENKLMSLQSEVVQLQAESEASTQRTEQLRNETRQASVALEARLGALGTEAGDLRQAVELLTMDLDESMERVEERQTLQLAEMSRSVNSTAQEVAILLGNVGALREGLLDTRQDLTARNKALQREVTDNYASLKNSVRVSEVAMQVI